MGHVQRLIAFDLDGTLVDSQRDLTDSANQLITELGGAPLPEDALGRMVGEGAARLVGRALAAAGVGDGRDAVPPALSRFLEIYDDRLLNHTRPYEGIAKVVAAARRDARVAVLTNKPAGASERILTGLGLRGLFDEVVGGDGPLPRKPDPAALVDLMQRAGATAPNTLLVGDSPIDRETARRASSRCCVVAYGFGFQMFQADPLTADDWIAADASELAAIIARFVGGGPKGQTYG